MTQSASFVDRLFKIKRHIVAEDQRAFLLRGGRLTEILGPGDHSWFDLTDSIAIEAHRPGHYLLESNFKSALISEHRELMERHFELVETQHDEVALVRDGARLVDVVAPAKRKLYWKDTNQISAEIISVGEHIDIPAAIRRELRQCSTCSYDTPYVLATVADHHVGLLVKGGKQIGKLPAGQHGFWNLDQDISIKVQDMRPQIIEITGQEVLSKDRVTLRINLTLMIEIADLDKAMASSTSWSDHLHRLAQFALRQACGNRSLDQLLGDKQALDAEIETALKPHATGLGLTLHELGIKDVILPGDIREIMNQVVAAEKKAQANLIHRREETAATRSLLNTAKLMDSNPTLMRLKELETLEKVTEQVQVLNINSGFDAVLDRLVTLRGKDDGKTG